MTLTMIIYRTYIYMNLYLFKTHPPNLILRAPQNVHSNGCNESWLKIAVYASAGTTRCPYWRLGTHSEAAATLAEVLLKPSDGLSLSLKTGVTKDEHTQKD